MSWNNLQKQQERHVLKSGAITKWTFGFLLSLAASSSFAATVINTVPSWDLSDSICCFGVPDTQTYGQVITAPAGETSLTSFTFWIHDGGISIALLGEVYAWDAINSRATGAALFESGTVLTGGVNTFEPITFTIPGGAPVTAGQQYVIFASTSKSAQVGSGAQWGFLPNDTTYPGGTMVYQNNGTSFADWNTLSWTFAGADLAFTAGFGGATVANIPTLDGSMMLMLAAALALVGLVVLRFRNS
jgi:hypothetical protein